MPGRFLTSEPKSKPAAFLGQAKDSQKADPKDPKYPHEDPELQPLTDVPRRLSADDSSEPKVALGLMLPPPSKELRGLQKKLDKHFLK